MFLSWRLAPLFALLCIHVPGAQGADKVSPKAGSVTAIRFPLKLIPESSTADAASVLQSQGFKQDDGVSDSKKMSDITGAITYKHFKSDNLNLEYWNGKLFNLRVNHSGIDGCENMILIYKDAISFIKNSYDLSKAKMSSGPNFGSKRCKNYMDEGSVIWGAVTKDYQISVDSFWSDDRYYVYVSYLYMPTQRAIDAQESGEMKKSDERARSNL